MRQVGARYCVEGQAGLLDRSSARSRCRTVLPRIGSQAIAALRRLRMTGAEIAMVLGDAALDGLGGLARIGLGKLSRLEPPEPPNRYERHARAS